MSRRGVALLIAVVGAGLAALVALSAALMAERASRTARAWRDALRVETAAGSGLDRALAQWPAAFAVPCCGWGVPAISTDTIGGVEVVLELVWWPDSTALLIARSSWSVARREEAVLVRLEADSTLPAVVGGARVLGTGKDRFMLRP